MDPSLEIRAKMTFSVLEIFGNFFDSKKNLKILLSHALLSSKLNMDQKIYRRISDNIYQTLQEHKEASRELQKIQLKKGQTLFEKMQNSRKDQVPSKNIAPLN
jgi:hypothetical protein